MKTKRHIDAGTVVGILLLILPNILGVGCISIQWSSLYPHFGWWGEEAAMNAEEESEMLAD